MKLSRLLSLSTAVLALLVLGMLAHITHDAWVLAERLRNAIAQEPLTLTDGHILRVTASFGVASPCGPQAALDDLLHAADLALYRAKRKGRNCVEGAA
ncbi:diguanylate cyclase [Duganella rivi]|uniref:diguanylate cyclase n=1 Tax=Duganella rivi TaxID=2666083 RepID=UPI001E5CF1D0|nr:diguanylate cyclase [Duganella rivi]